MQKFYDTLKKALITAPVLGYPDFSKPFLVAADASSAAVGAALSQLNENGREYPVYYASRSLNEAEKNYSTYERERVAIFLHRISFDITSYARISSCSWIVKLRNASSIIENHMEESLDG